MQGKVSLGALAETYVRRRVELREITPSTGRTTRQCLRSFVASYGNRPPGRMGQADIERWMRARQHVAPGTMRLNVQHVRQFVQWLRNEDVIRRDPMRAIRTPKVPRSVPRALPADHVDALMAVLPDARAVAIVMLMLGLGLRVAEVAGLQVGDWDEHGGTITVAGKGGHVRLLPMPERVAEALNRYRPGRSRGPLIQRADGHGGLAPSTIGILMAEWMRAAGVKRAAFDGRSCHALRHTLASGVADVEPDLRVTQQILGHRHLTSTQIYLRGVEADRMRTALESVA